MKLSREINAKRLNESQRLFRLLKNMLGGSIKNNVAGFTIQAIAYEYNSEFHTKCIIPHNQFW